MSLVRSQKLLKNMVALVSSNSTPNNKNLIFLNRVLDYLKIHKTRYGLLFLLAISLFLKWNHDKKIQIFAHKTELNKYLLEKLKPRIDSYNPTFWLPFSLIKSAYFGKWTTAYLRDYLRWEYKYKDGSTVGLDIHPRPFPKDKPLNTPTIFIVPGIFTESGDHQIRTLVKYIWKTLGWRSIVMNRIGFSGLTVTGKFLCSIDSFGEFHGIIKAIKKRFDNCPVYLFGTSMGACYTQRYIEEYSGQLQVEAAATISSPWSVTNA